MTLERMDYLGFLLSDFTRFSWANETARSVWESRIFQIARAWFEIEWQAVLAGVRSCGLTILPPDELVSKTDKWVQYGLISIPLEIQGFSDSVYSSTGTEYETGNPFVYRVVILRPESMMDFKSAWARNDQKKIGDLLGYPACCQKFFQEVWVGQNRVDTTWPMAVRTDSFEMAEKTLEVAGPPEANILWRWMGIRAVPHLPCSFTCQPTVDFGRQLLQVGRDSGYDQEMDWMLEILSWPVEWSALHGIAEIKTPILRVSARTDATPWKYVVRRKSSAYPAEGATGLGFPYRAPQKISPGPGHRQLGLESPSDSTELFPDWYATDNGFSSTTAMDQAHAAIIQVALSTLNQQSGNMLDLGCGNGALLSKILARTPQIQPFGVERDPARHRHSAELLPQYFDHFECGDLFESESVWENGRQFNLVLLMPARLLEANPERVEQLKTRIQEQADHLLIYAYGDWLDRYGGLQELARQTGLRLVDPKPGLTAGLAVFEESWTAQAV